MAVQQKSEFNKVLSAWDVLVLALGAMIGWGWVVSSGDWITLGGVVGAIIGFVIGGVMVFFVGLTCAELTSAMPQCGGEHTWSFRAMGPVGSFVCTWAIILGYTGVVCFEACALPTIIQYIFPGFMQGYLYTVAGFDVYAGWLVVAVIVAIAILAVNVRGVKAAARPAAHRRAGPLRDRAHRRQPRAALPRGGGRPRRPAGPGRVGAPGRRGDDRRHGDQHGRRHPCPWHGAPRQRRRRDIVHGQGLAALEPVAVEASYRADPVKFGRVSQLLGGCAAVGCADRLRALLRDVDLEVRLSDLGVVRVDRPPASVPAPRPR